MPDDSAKMDYEYRKRRYETYTKERDALRADSLEVSGRYDRTVLTLAGGGLALSITFLEKIAPSPKPWTFVLLALAWACLIAAVLLELFALSKSQTITNENIEAITEEYRQYLLSLPEHPPIPEPPRLPASQAEIEKWKARTRSYNVWSRNLLAAGVIFLCLFSVLNLAYSSGGRRNGRTQTDTANKRVEGYLCGAVQHPSATSTAFNRSEGSTCCESERHAFAGWRYKHARHRREVNSSPAWQ